MLKYKPLLIILLIAVVYSLLFNVLIIGAKLSFYLFNPWDQVKNLLLVFYNSVLFTYIYFIVFYFNRKLFLSILYITFVLSALSTYYSLSYKIEIDENVLKAVLMADKVEFYTFINETTILVILGSLAVATILSILVCKTYRLAPYQAKLSFVSLIFLLSVNVFQGAEITAHYQPYNFIKNMILAIRSSIITLPELENVANKYHYTLANSKQEDLNIIFVIGESARSDHFSLNGYKRNTNPLLGQESNLISFDKAYGCFNFTYLAVPCLLTRMNDDLKIKETSFINVFNKMGFASFWLGNQGGTDLVFENYFNKIAKEASQKLIINIDAQAKTGYDAEMLPYIKQFINKNYKLNLLLLHPRGSHFKYDDRYPETFKRYHPTCDSNHVRVFTQCTHEEIINSYDNSILYTDYFLAEVIKNFSNSNSLMIYISDHGEPLGEDGTYLRNQNHITRNQLHVPLIIWASDKFIANYPDKYQAIKAKKHNEINYKNIFHTVLDCAGIESEAIDKSLSLCH